MQPETLAGGLLTTSELPGLSVLLVIIAALGVFHIVRSLVAMRQGVTHLGRALMIAAIASGAAYFALVNSGVAPTVAQLGAVVAGFAVYCLIPARSRHIPKDVRRKVLERDLKGKQIQPGEYHVDHRWPFALGGSSTPDNLRAIPKKENLRKGKKTPTIWDWL